MDDTLTLASKAACDNRPGCAAQMSKGLKTPVGHFYHFTVAGQEVEIECVRAYFLEGDYACKDKAHGLFASLSASAAASSSAAALAPVTTSALAATPASAPKIAMPAPKPRK